MWHVVIHAIMLFQVRFRFHFSQLIGNGEVFTWGRNSKGELGLGHSDDVTQPQQISALRDKIVSKAHCVDGHAAALVTRKYQTTESKPSKKLCQLM
jgi:alpha-tubulin suppressor-like RCC1 family protein